MFSRLKKNLGTQIQPCGTRLFISKEKIHCPLFVHTLLAGNVDAPGQYRALALRREKPVYAFEFSGRRYDIGSIESMRK